MPMISFSLHLYFMHVPHQSEQFTHPPNSTITNPKFPLIHTTAVAASVTARQQWQVQSPHLHSIRVSRRRKEPPSPIQHPQRKKRRGKRRRTIKLDVPHNRPPFAGCVNHRRLDFSYPYLFSVLLCALHFVQLTRQANH
jgi:hypothetical protein